MRLADEIRRARRARGITQAKLAERMHISRAAVTQWESGLHRPTPINLAQLSEVLGYKFAAEDIRPAASASGAAGQRSDPSSDKRNFAAAAETLLQILSPHWKKDQLTIFESEASTEDASDLVIRPEVSLYLDRRLLPSAYVAHSGIIVRGDKLLPTFQDGELMLLGGAGSLGKGDAVLVLARFSGLGRPALFGILTELEPDRMLVRRGSPALEEWITLPDYDAVFRVVTAGKRL